MPSRSPIHKSTGTYRIVGGYFFDRLTPPKPEPEQSNAGRNLDAWAAALRAVGHSAWERLDTRRERGFENLERLRLPRYRRITVPLVDFYRNPNPYFDQLGTERFWFSAIPSNPSLERLTDSGMTRSEVIACLDRRCATEARPYYRLNLLQYFENLYGGSIIVGPEGRVLVEFKKGRQEGIDTGAATPEYYALRDQFLGTLKYSFGDRELRQAIFNTLQAISIVAAEGRRELRQGYYEFILTRREPKSELEPIFFDCREKRSYQIPWEEMERMLYFAAPANV